MENELLKAISSELNLFERIIIMLFKRIFMKLYKSGVKKGFNWNNN